MKQVRPVLAAMVATALAACTTGSASPVPPSALPSAFEAGWKGREVCKLLVDNAQMRAARCTFPPGVGHERHYHPPHWGYIVEGSTMRIVSPAGTVVRELKAGSSWWSDGIDWHEPVNVGTTTGVYVIVEPKTGR